MTIVNISLVITATATALMTGLFYAFPVSVMPGSPRLINLLTDIDPNSNHVYPLGLDKSEDREVWQ
jgi:hypothetical protein